MVRKCNHYRKEFLLMDAVSQAAAGAVHFVYNLLWGDLFAIPLPGGSEL